MLEHLSLEDARREGICISLPTYLIILVLLSLPQLDCGRYSLCYHTRVHVVSSSLSQELGFW